MVSRDIAPQISSKLDKAGFDGNGRFGDHNHISQGISIILGDFKIVARDLDDWAKTDPGPNGNQNFSLEWAVGEPAPIDTAVLHLTWYQFASGKYESVAYITGPIEMLPSFLTLLDLNRYLGDELKKMGFKPTPVGRDSMYVRCGPMQYRFYDVEGPARFDIKGIYKIEFLEESSKNFSGEHKEFGFITTQVPFRYTAHSMSRAIVTVKDCIKDVSERLAKCRADWEIPTEDELRKEWAFMDEDDRGYSLASAGQLTKYSPQDVEVRKTFDEILDERKGDEEAKQKFLRGMRVHLREGGAKIMSDEPLVAFGTSAPGFSVGDIVRLNRAGIGKYGDGFDDRRLPLLEGGLRIIEIKSCELGPFAIIQYANGERDDGGVLLKFLEIDFDYLDEPLVAFSSNRKYLTIGIGLVIAAMVLGYIITRNKINKSYV